MRKVFIAVRSEIERHGWHHPMLTEWLLSLRWEVDFQTDIRLIHGLTGYAAPSNRAAMDFMTTDCEWFCLVDNDVIPPLNMLHILDTVPTDAAIIGPVCHGGREDTIFPQAGVLIGENFTPVTGMPDLYEVMQVGGGCWFVHRDVFKKMEIPYFKLTFDPLTFAMTESDDIYFQRRARELGFRLFCDSHFICSHFHSLDLSLDLKRMGTSESRDEKEAKSSKYLKARSEALGKKIQEMFAALVQTHGESKCL